MNDQLLLRYAADVPDVDEENPICWVEYLNQHGNTGRRVARAVLELYEGNAAKVARMLDVSPATVNKHVQHPVMRFMLGERKPITVPEFAVADRDERAETLTTILRSSHIDVKDRLKALELLGKMHADYTDKVEVKGEITTLHELVRSLAEEPPPKASAPTLEPHTELIAAPEAVPAERVRLTREPSLEDLMQ